MPLNPTLLENRGWAEEHLGDLQRQYLNKWIGVLDRTVAVSAASLSEVKIFLGDRKDEAYIMKVTKSAGKLW